MVIMTIMAASKMARVNMISSTLKVHTNAHTVRGRPTLKDVERFRNGSNLMRDRELYERTFLSEPSISNELYTELSNMNSKPIHKHRQVPRHDREPSRLPVRTIERLKNKSRKV